MSGVVYSRRDVIKLMSLAGIGGVAVVACGPGTTAPPSGAGSAVAPPNGASPTAAELVELKYVNHWGAPADNHSKALTELINDFEAENPNIKIDNVVVDSTTTVSKSQTDCAAGNCPDIIHETGYLFLKSGWLLDLAPYVTGEWKSRFVPGALEALTFDGQLSALPLEVSPIVTIWNAALVDEVGGQIPTTWDEMLDLGELAKAKGVYLLSLPASWGMPNDLIWGYPGGQEAMEAGQWDNPALRFGAQALKDLMDRKLIAPNDLDLNEVQGTALFQQRKALSISNGAWTIGNWLMPKGVDEFGLEKDVVFTPGVRPVADGKRAVRVYAGGVGLAAALATDEQRLDSALAFMDFWTTKDRGQKWVAAGASPTGVDFEVPAGRPLLGELLEQTKSAELVYAPTKPSFMSSGVWVHTMPLRSAIAAGQSVDEAVAVYAAEQEKAAAAAG